MATVTSEKARKSLAAVKLREAAAAWAANLHADLADPDDSKGLRRWEALAKAAAEFATNHGEVNMARIQDVMVDVVRGMTDAEAVAVWKVLGMAVENARSDEEIDAEHALAGAVSDRLDAAVVPLIEGELALNLADGSWESVEMVRPGEG